MTEPKYISLYISLWVISQSKKIIYGYPVKVCQLYQNRCGDIPLIQLIIAVYLLRAVQVGGNLPLLNISIFS